MAEDPRSELEFSHEPVMVDEVVALVSDLPAGVFLDATVGGGSHSAAILAACPDLDLVGIDRDPVALDAAAAKLAAFDCRVNLRKARFDDLEDVLKSLDVEKLSGFLFDLGVSSPQLDVAERGFSFRNDGPLDMRMDRTSGLKASDVVNDYSQAELTSLLRVNGDERFAGRIAKAIVAARPIETTVELSRIVVGAIPAATRRTGGHPAKRSFQAIRIAVNDELTVLRPALVDALEYLSDGGMGLVLTYHSGEDKITKDLFRERSTVNIPPGIPVPATDPDFTVLRPLAMRPSEAEQQRNRRASSARLRRITRNSGALAA